jgi:hypothetical protein
VPGIAPVWQERPELGIPGLDYMPPPQDGRPPVGGVHRRDRPRLPWRWLTAGVALVVLSALALTWLLAGTTDGPRRPRVTAPATDPLASDLPSAGVPPLPTGSGFPGGTSSPGASSPSVTMSPSSASPSPTASPRPQQVRVPDVLGDRQAAAEAALRAAGFAAAVQLVPAPSPRQARRVISQRPAPGQLAQPGSVVTLVVGDR